jgi:hypothetical protein
MVVYADGNSPWDFQVPTPANLCPHGFYCFMDSGNANCELDGRRFSKGHLGRTVQSVGKVEFPQNIAPEPAKRQKVFSVTNAGTEATVSDTAEFRLANGKIAEDWPCPGYLPHPLASASGHPDIAMM